MIDFPCNDESILLKFDISRWPSIISSVQVSVNGFSLGDPITPSDEYRTIEMPITYDIASGKIKFESLSKRFFLDNIIVESQYITSIPAITDKLDPVIIFPNPAYDYITFSNIKAYRFLEVSDINGTILKAIKADGTDILEVSIADFHPGVYFIRLFSNEGFITSKIIKFK